MARPERFELPTSWFVARHSIQLSYGRVLVIQWSQAALQMPIHGCAMQRERILTSPGDLLNPYLDGNVEFGR